MQEFTNNPWTSPFYKYEADNKHKIKLEKNLPKPIIATINLNEYYGERQLQADSAHKMFFKKQLMWQELEING